MTTKHDNKQPGPASNRAVLSPGAGAGMGVGVGAALTAATGDGWWIGVFAAFGATVALTMSALSNRTSCVMERRFLTRGDRRDND